MYFGHKADVMQSDDQKVVITTLSDVVMLFRVAFSRALVAGRVFVLPLGGNVWYGGDVLI